MRRIAEENLRFKFCDKSLTKAAKMSRVARCNLLLCLFLVSETSPDLNPMDYYV